MKAMYPISAALGTALVLVSSTASAQSLKKIDGMLADAAGMTVYTFDKDKPGSGKSACNDGCAKMWPPVPVTGDSVTSPYSVVTRDDGSKQLAYKGKPLYLYAKDAKAGERKGDKVMDVWHVVSD
ncbi:MAG: hypothetical protein AB1807_01570 [Pseudomonadota bacterium]